METGPSQPLELFYCYARRDRALCDELNIHLAGLRNSGLITTWYDGEVVPGTHREQEIETHLESAHLILLLVSPDFIASESCYSKEMGRAIERHHRKEARVIPILLRAVDWKGTPFSKIQMLPSDGRPVTSWSNRDEAFHNVATGIRRAVDNLLSQQPPDPIPVLNYLTQKRPSWRGFSLLMGGVLALISIILLLSLLISLVVDRDLFRPTSTAKVSPQPTSTAKVPLGVGKDGIGVNLVGGEYIGISDGKYALDINRNAGPFMLEASESLRNEHLGNALAEWSSAYEKETNDAEPLIYEEDQRVIISGRSYITVVLGVTVPDSFSRDVLQAAYIVQRECNDNPQVSGGKKLRLLIATSGSNPDNVPVIAHQIVEAAQHDNTIVGVQGWTTPLTTLNAVPILASAHLPIVAGDTASDALTGISTYFYRLGASNIVGTPFKTNYIEKELAPQRTVIFRDHTDPDSTNSADDFAKRFINDGYHIASTEDFQTAKDGQKGKLAQHVQDVLTKYKPDFLFLATTSVSDVKIVLNTISANAKYANLKVLTGEAGYELVQSGEKINGYAHLLISSAAFPDEWSILDLGESPPLFFNDYPLEYDPYNQHIESPYTYRRANGSVMIDYDALYTFLIGCKIAIQQGKQDPPAPEDLKNALSQINGLQSFQGVAGAISFGHDGDPINKLHFILIVDDSLHLHVAAYQGCLLVSPACDTSIHIS